jgi:hypothetical protein
MTESQTQVYIPEEVKRKAIAVAPERPASGNAM